MGLQLFIAGLRPQLHSKLMETDPAAMRQAFEAAVNFEGLLKEPTHTTKPIHFVEKTREREVNGMWNRTKGKTTRRSK